MDFYVGLLTYNNVKYTKLAIASFRTRYPHRWVIVDNHSSDATLDFLRDLKKDPKFTIFCNEENVGVAAGWNQIIKLVLEDPESKYCLMVSNDVLFEPDTVDILMDFIKEHPEYLLVSPLDTHRYEKRDSRIKENTVDFACFLISRKCIEKVGFFDEEFKPAYYEDDDYTFRVRRSRVKFCTVAYAGIYHFGSVTLRKGSINTKNIISISFIENREYFRRKWGFVPGPETPLWIIFAGFFWGGLLNAPIGLKQRAIKAYLNWFVASAKSKID